MSATYFPDNKNLKNRESKNKCTVHLSYWGLEFTQCHKASELWKQGKKVEDLCKRPI